MRINFEHFATRILFRDALGQPQWHVHERSNGKSCLNVRITGRDPRLDTLALFVFITCNFLF